MSDSAFPVTEVDGRAVVTTPDEIDIGNASLLRAALQAAAGHQVVIVDMTGTEFCDSSGLNVLVRARKRADEDGGEVRLVVRGAALLRILTVTGVGTMFRLFESLSEALAAA